MLVVRAAGVGRRTIQSAVWLVLTANMPCEVPTPANDSGNAKAEHGRQGNIRQSKGENLTRLSLRFGDYSRQLSAADNFVKFNSIRICAFDSQKDRDRPTDYIPLAPNLVMQVQRGAVTQVLLAAPPPAPQFYSSEHRCLVNANPL
jgi:hypothetical protein